MRKVILYMVMSADGFICGPNNELDWENQDEAVSRYLIPQLLSRVDTMVLGRVLYQGFEQAWPAMAKNETLPPDLIDFAHWIERTTKVVFSNTLEEVTWQHSQLVKIKDEHDIAEEVKRLKSLEGEDIVLFGGARTAQTFAKLGLVDEYWIKLQPIALGAGKGLFKDLTGRLKLHLIDVKSFESGVVALRYQSMQ